ncbi:cytochrome P450 [Nocardia brevicatena]|uniref:cytochrome P450 n=1 Tax=Nocardia brevicatena TaxID=37327 RepID=UPI0003185768|nr:cytochrome P450 [Nocardia brevicatena]
MAEDYRNVPNDGTLISVTFKGSPAWPVTGFDDVRRVPTEPRTTPEPTDLDGQRLDAGKLITVAMDAANREGQVFAAPDTFDIHNDSRGHPAFGSGIHSCLGAQLARIELQV